MARRKITKSQSICIVLLWILLCYMLFAYSETVDFYTIFIVITSAVIVFVPLYKNRKRP
jgi:hypothetical protein